MLYVILVQRGKRGEYLERKHRISTDEYEFWYTRDLEAAKKYKTEQAAKAAGTKMFGRGFSVEPYEEPLDVFGKLG